MDQFLADEDRYHAVRAASYDGIDPTELKAVELITYAHPIPDGVLPSYDGCGAVTIQEPDVICRDLGHERDALVSIPLTFIDRDDAVHGPWPLAQLLARRIAEIHSERVLAHIRAEERDLQHKAIHGEEFQWSKKDPVRFIPPDHFAERLGEEQPAFDLVRARCGAARVERFDEIAALRTENARLRELLEEAAAALKYEGRHRLAAKLCRERDTLN